MGKMVRFYNYANLWQPLNLTTQELISGSAASKLVHAHNTSLSQPCLDGKSHSPKLPQDLYLLLTRLRLRVEFLWDLKKTFMNVAFESSKIFTEQGLPTKYNCLACLIQVWLVISWSHLLLFTCPTLTIHYNKSVTKKSSFSKGSAHLMNQTVW